MYRGKMFLQISAIIIWVKLLIISCELRNIQWYKTYVTQNLLNETGVTTLLFPCPNKRRCVMMASILDWNPHTACYNGALCKVSDLITYSNVPPYDINVWDCMIDEEPKPVCMHGNGTALVNLTIWAESCTIYNCVNGVRITILVGAENCVTLWEKGVVDYGPQTICPYNGNLTRPVEVVCDYDGWTIFQLRKNMPQRISFYRKYLQYQIGFGNVELEFWAGLDNIRAIYLTAPAMMLKVKLNDFEGNHVYALYSSFSIGNESSGYKLGASRYSGDAGDSLAYHNGMMFSTKDHGSPCAVSFQGGWWYNRCHVSNLNGLPIVGSSSDNGKGITWYHFRGYNYSLECSMMMKPLP